MVSLKVANLLLDKGASANLVNVFGQTALDRATQGRGGDTMRRLLEEFGGVCTQGEGGKKKKRGKKDGEQAAGGGAAASAVAAVAGAASGVTGGDAMAAAATATNAGQKKKGEKSAGKDQKEPAGNCRFEKGKCPFGPKCRFSHGTAGAPSGESNQLRQSSYIFFLCF